MGFLDAGETMTWEEVVFVIDYVKRVSLLFGAFFFCLAGLFLTVAAARTEATRQHFPKEP